MVTTIGVYVDDGADFETLLREVTKEIDHAQARVLPLLAEDIIHFPSLFDDMVAFIMPGGADLAYCAKLNGAGNRQIRNYVASGGRYLGICAGAYYACRKVEFHKGCRDEVEGSRELALVDAVAIGSLGELGRLYDLTIRSASAAWVNWHEIGALRLYYNGGPRFERGKVPEGGVIATYVDYPGTAPAVIDAPVGDGLAILTGVHVEMSGQSLALSLAKLTDGSTYGHLAEWLRSSEKGRRMAFRSLLGLCRLPLKAASEFEKRNPS